MNIPELILLALGLSMDAFAVAICKGLAIKKLTAKSVVTVGGWFGVFQALMPFLGYLLGTAFDKYISAFDHWISFGLLGLIGVNMIRESLSGEENSSDDSTSVGTMLVLAIATSIDALAVGITFAFLVEGAGQLVFAFSAIGVITFALSCLGVKLGSIFGVKYKKRAEIFGGVVLILLGIKILLEHLGIINF